MDALKTAENRVVGTKQVLRAIKASPARCVYLANDCDTFIYQQVVRAAEDAHVKVVRVPTMKELGEAAGIEVATAAAARL